jgi:NADH:ubiquinone oxidoreductase subunit 2 (subunit N)
MAALMLSLAGLPPMVGFYAKLSVLSAVIDAGYLWLAVVAVLFSLIGAFLLPAHRHAHVFRRAGRPHPD